MRIIRTGPFKRDFRRLPERIKRRTEKALRLLVTDFRHPSLRARKVDRKREIWKANINGGWRFTFQVEGDFYLLRRVGSHEEMLREERW